MLMKNLFVKRLVIGLLLALSVFVFAACSPGNNGGENEEVNMDNHEMNDHETNDHEMNDMEHDAEHEHDEERIPNEGASIEITSPADGDTFAAGDEITVEVSVDGFELDNEGSHWHVYVDDTSWGMVQGGRLNEVLRGVEAGEHEIMVFLASGDHIELMEGASIMITVE